MCEISIPGQKSSEILLTVQLNVSQERSLSVSSCPGVISCAEEGIGSPSFSGQSGLLASKAKAPGTRPEKIHCADEDWGENTNSGTPTAWMEYASAATYVSVSALITYRAAGPRNSTSHQPPQTHSPTHRTGENGSWLKKLGDNRPGLTKQGELDKSRSHLFLEA